LNAFDFVIPAKTVAGMGYKIRVISLDDELSLSISSKFDIHVRPVIDVITPQHGQSMTIRKSNAVEWLDAVETVGVDVHVSF
jgi:hypothetical protein